VRAGNYPGVTIADRTNLPAGAKVEIHPAPGENVVFLEEVVIKTHDLVVDGGDTAGVDEPDRFQINGDQGGSDQAASFGWGNNSPRVTGNVFEDVHARNVNFDDGSRGNTARFNNIGPSNLGGRNLCSDLVQSGEAQFTVEFNTIHDNLGTGCGGAHIDALDLNPDDTGSVVRGNRIWWCGTQCIFAGDPGRMLIEHNMIEETNACGDGCDGPQELAVMGDVEVRFNTIEGGTGYGREPDRPGNANVHHNVFLSGPGCSTDTSGAVLVSCTNNVSCAPRLADGSLWTNVDRQARYALDPNDSCSAGKGASDPRIP
jgi:hypothetical protein